MISSYDPEIDSYYEKDEKQFNFYLLFQPKIQKIFPMKFMKRIIHPAIFEWQPLVMLFWTNVRPAWHEKGIKSKEVEKHSSYCKYVQHELGNPFHFYTLSQLYSPLFISRFLILFFLFIFIFIFPWSLNWQQILVFTRYIRKFILGSPHPQWQISLIRVTLIFYMSLFKTSLLTIQIQWFFWIET